VTGANSGTRREHRRIDVDRLVARIAALQRFSEAAAGHLTDDDLKPARTVIDRAGSRLAVSRDHTVVALAGATGSGKSSLFNTLTGTRTSTVGVRRPTTGTAHAFTWADQNAADLLDWLDIPADRRFTAAGTVGADTDPRLAGLVLLDLPDFDSVQAAHRAEADRLLDMVDLVVWVTDPQKYADRLLHHEYLQMFNRHVETTIVVLNQADRLTDADTRNCLADLTALLADDGFPGIPVLAVSATTDQPGVTDLTRVLRTAVSRRAAALQRLSADVEHAVQASRHLLGAGTAGSIERRTSSDLVSALAVSAGVPAVADAADRAYRSRAKKSMGWPLSRWIRRLRIDPLAQLRLGLSNAGLAEASSLPPADRITRAVADLAVRKLGDEAGQGLPAPWTGAIIRAGRSQQASLPDALDRAIVTTDIGMDRKPGWWRIIGSLQWALTVLALAGGLWLLARIVLIALGLTQLRLPETGVPDVGRVPYATLALCIGALAGILIALLIKPMFAAGARRARRRADSRLNTAIADITRTHILAPVQEVLDDYADACRALADAAR
jgi:GTP-binding protein EngB required for normal cell division